MAPLLLQYRGMASDGITPIFVANFLYQNASFAASDAAIYYDSTMEAEYIAASEAAKEAFWYKKFATKTRVMPLDAIPLYYDNNGTIALAKDPRSHQKFKHIEQ